MELRDLGTGSIYKEVVYKLGIRYNYTLETVKLLFDLQKVPSESNDVWQWDTFLKIELHQGHITLKKK